VGRVDRCGNGPGENWEVRLSFIDALRQFDPLDAVVLKERDVKPGAPTPAVAAFLKNRRSVSHEEIAIAVENLMRLKCAVHANSIVNFFLTRSAGAC